MKKILLVFSVFVLGISFSFAQTQVKPGVGINFTNITGDGADAKGQVGWQIGASVAFGEKFYIEPGAFYQTSSFEYVTSDSAPVTDATYHGIRIPVALGLDVLGNADSAFGLRIFGGGSTYIVTGTSSEFLDKDDISSPQWGVFAGAGLDIAIFYIDASYQWSVTNIQEDVSNIDLGNTKGFFLTAGLRF
ncbi:outer membrane beta-barrel protein [Algoriphagus halophilus]|uniref:outer membrane beta-barrel protein n=1 Tax=Algoriphagus halophilus TaxID=226505 RepID=UPI00358E4CD5